MDVLGRLSAALAARYEVESELGRGGMAVVYRARDLKHDRTVAIKVLRPELSAALGADRFVREIRIAAQLQHPHIIALYDSGEADGILYYVMPYVEGESLRSRLDRQGQLSVDEALEVAREVADALSYAHSHGVVHRDIKPENILLSGGHAAVADFGIARAIAVSAADPSTETGIALGTPAYMSPEQAAGEQRVDGRSDIYALGCVLYEMLAGEPPFGGATVQATLARHLQDAPPSLRTVRPSVPVGLEKVLEISLAKAPADRFSTATEFVEAVKQVAAGRMPRRRRSWRWVAAAVAVLAVIGAVGTQMFGRTELDMSAFVILPFEHRDGAAPKLLNGSMCESLLSDALRQFSDVSVIDHFLVRDAIDRRARRGRAAFQAAESWGAGRVVEGEVESFGDSIRVVAVVLDARSRRPVSRAAVAISADLSDLTEGFRLLAARILGLEAAADGGGIVGTISAEAARAFVDARDSVLSGSFTGAARLFRRATELDPDYASAHLWFAQVQAWSGAPASDWRHSASRAVDLNDALPSRRDRDLASALLRMAEGQLVQACSAYEQIVDRNPEDYAGWVGLGECYARDSVVVRDPDSPSGWAFRSSRHAAIQAYRRGLALTPFLTHGVYERLSRLLPQHGAELRRGAPLSPDTGHFLAYPGFAADTFSWVPYRGEELATYATVPAGLRTAVSRGRSELRSIVASWMTAYPLSVAARLRLSQTHEAFADLAQAQVVLGEARAIAREPVEQLLVETARVRLLVKRRAFSEARALADSVMASWREPPAGYAERLAALAALTGRADKAARYLAADASLRREAALRRGLNVMDTPLFAALGRARAYAALGGPKDSVAAALRRFDERLEAAAPPMEHGRVRQALLVQTSILTYAVTGPTEFHHPDTPNYLLRLQALHARGQRSAAIEALGQLQRQEAAAGEVDLAMLYQETLVQLALGDTAEAVRRLDRSLNALSAHRLDLYNDVPFPAALVRAMALRAELADAAGDRDKASEWAAPVVALWADADPELLRVVERVQGLVR